VVEKLNDKWFRIIGIPLIAFFGDWIFYDEINRQHGQSFWLDVAAGTIESSLLWTIARHGIIRSRRRFPDLNQTRQRLGYQIVWFFITTAVFRFGTSFLYDVTLLWGYHYTAMRYVYNIAASIFCVIPIAAIFEGIYLYRHWKVTYYEAEELKKINLQTQLESLKEQVKPHFLFNSLNTLQGLVLEDEKQKAVSFIGNLSHVYRYLLHSNEQPLIPLERELEFVRAYIDLLKTRFENSLNLLIEIDPTLFDYHLPPLTLQMLVENAVKHNVVSSTRPLTIRIYSDLAHNLIILNNLQKKKTTMPSSKTGLMNISAKYRLLNQPDIVIQQTDAYFQVIVPLMKPETA
jgi:sensor histidine kinase YesM